jgi:iron(III) transport system permease protein
VTAGAGGRRPAGLTVAAFAAAGIVALPMVVLLSGLLQPATGTFRRLWDTILPEAVRGTLLLGLGVGVLTLVLGTALAALVTFWDFPGRGVMEWALVMPLAIPGYVLTFVILRQWDSDGAVPSALRATFGDDAIRSLPGAILVLSLVLYPYVYVLARSAFTGQSRSELEAAQSLGLSRRRAILRVALPTARPAIAAGVALSVMEAIADFGTVNLLRVPTLTEAVYRTWYGEFDREAGTQIASLLLLIALVLLASERLARGRARYEQSLRRGLVGPPVRLTGLAGWLALAGPALLLLVVVVAPGAQLAVWALQTLAREGGEGYADLAVNSIVLGIAAAVAACVLGTLVSFAMRTAPSRPLSVAARIAGSGYALPGAVVAVSVITIYAWVDDRLLDLGTRVGTEPALLLTGTALGLVLAYLVRFLSVALNATEAHMARVPRRLDEAARALGVTGLRALVRVQLPLLRPGIVAAFLLVFVDVVKELPITALLRPFGWDTLAIGVWQATSDARYDAAALPALTIVLVGLLPVILLVRASRVDLPG